MTQTRMHILNRISGSITNKVSITLVPILVMTVGLMSFTLEQAWASDGRVPLYQHTTITSSGHYYLTNDIAISSGSVLNIEADNVTIDLNQHIIGSYASTGDIIYIAGGHTNITIKNGRIIGGGHGIYYNSTTDQIRLHIHNVTISDSVGAIYCNGADEIIVSDCIFQSLSGDALYLSAGEAIFSGKVSHNSFQDIDGSALVIVNMNPGQIMGNVFKGFGYTSQGYGISISGTGTAFAGGNLIEGNTVSGGTTVGSAGMFIWNSNGNTIRNNVISNNNADGLTINSNGNTLFGNTVNGNFLGNGITFSASATYNLIDANHCQGNSGYGLLFGATGLNAYRNNMLRGNAIGPLQDPGNTDAGGNIY
ncbi:right-handed parallel beta-helix repeat-containing protein [bacterium]|nr:right-handed parallel beta-helix repeat-containing protein [bacterium]